MTRTAPRTAPRAAPAGAVRSRPPAETRPAPEALFGGLSQAAFMRRHWQKKPLLVRQAFAGIVAPLTRQQLFSLAGREGVESRLIQRPQATPGAGWSMDKGPLRKGDLPPVRTPGWTLLVQGVNLHVPAAHALLAPFRFLPSARLDDVMVSWASPGGGVGPHFDSYDVFLIQVQGERRWRIADMPQARLQPDQPLKIIDGFAPQQEWVLAPGDMLYLPPGWAHDGDAVTGDCMTCSVGFRAPQADELTREILFRLADAQDDAIQDAEDAAAQGGAGSAAPRALYRDPAQRPTLNPGRVPAAMHRFARRGLMAALREPGWLERALGEYLSEPKAAVVFEPGPDRALGGALRLAPKTCMLYDDDHVFINGESLLAAGRDAELLRQLADAGRLSASDVACASRSARAVLQDWTASGWLLADVSGA